MPVMPDKHRPAKGTASHTHARLEKDRGSSTQRGYGYRWQLIREIHLRKHPLCVHCEAAGRFTPATELDHIQPHKGDKVLFWEQTNRQGLCKSCHSRKTASEDGGFGNAAQSVGK